MTQTNAPTEDAIKEKDFRAKCITKLKIEQINGNMVKLELVTDAGDVVRTIEYDKNKTIFFNNNP